MIILVGESGSGKTSVREAIVKQTTLSKAISCTTRNKREQEIEGADYNFLTTEDFEQKIQEGYFAEYAEYNGDYYGLPVEQITIDHIGIVEPKGLEQLKQNPELDYVVFYLTTLPSIRQTRMLNRGDSLEKIEARIKLDEDRFSHMGGLYDFLINTDEDSIEDIANNIVHYYNLATNEKKPLEEI